MDRRLPAIITLTQQDKELHSELFQACAANAAMIDAAAMVLADHFDCSPGTAEVAAEAALRAAFEAENGLKQNANQKRQLKEPLSHYSQILRPYGLFIWVILSLGIEMMRREGDCGLIWIKNAEVDDIIRFIMGD